MAAISEKAIWLWSSEENKVFTRNEIIEAFGPRGTGVELVVVTLMGGQHATIPGTSKHVHLGPGQVHYYRGAVDMSSRMYK